MGARYHRLAVVNRMQRKFQLLKRARFSPCMRQSSRNGGKNHVLYPPLFLKWRSIPATCRRSPISESPISESPIFWEILLQLIDEGQIVPVVGRDLLTLKDERGTTLLYPYLAEKLAATLEVPADNLPKGEELNEVACRYISRGDRIEDIYPALKTVAARAEANLAIPGPLLKLAEICPLRLFVSTTFDSFLARALNQVRYGGKPMTNILACSPTELLDLPRELKSSRELTEADRPFVFHLMGRLSATPAYAVTQEDFVEFFHALQSDTHRPARLFDELSRQSLLILGCRFGGWLTRFLMRMSKGQRLSAGGKHDYVADSGVSSDDNFVVFLRNFSRATKVYRSGDVLEFVDELHKRWKELHPATMTNAAPIPLTPAPVSQLQEGAVFLSYASEDRAAVQKIRTALEAAGVDVFFDRDALHVGDDWEAKLRRGIRQCSLFVPVISRQTLNPERRFFRVEWNLAVKEAGMASFSLEEMFLLPIVIDDTTPEQADVPAKFRDIQWNSLPGGETTPEFVYQVQKLYRKYQKSRAAAV